MNKTLNFQNNSIAFIYCVLFIWKNCDYLLCVHF